MLAAGSEIARLCQIAYREPGEERLAACERLGVRLVDEGADEHTCWVVVEGEARASAGAAAALRAEDVRWRAGSAQPPADAAAVKFVLVRGVKFDTADGGDRGAVSLALARSWATPLLARRPNAPLPPRAGTGDLSFDDGTLNFAAAERARAAAELFVGPSASVLAHAGLLGIAEDLFDVLASRGHLDACVGVRSGARDARVLLSGHSMGGALAMLLAAIASARALSCGEEPADRESGWLPTYTYGTLHALGAPGGAREAGEALLRRLGLADDAVRSFVLEGDPVPRSYGASDPLVLAARTAQGLADRLVGSASAGPAETPSSPDGMGGVAAGLPEMPSLPVPAVHVGVPFLPLGLTYVIRSDGVARRVEALAPGPAQDALGRSELAAGVLGGLGSGDVLAALQAPLVGVGLSLMDHSLYS